MVLCTIVGGWSFKLPMRVEVGNGCLCGRGEKVSPILPREFKTQRIVMENGQATLLGAL